MRLLRRSIQTQGSSASSRTSQQQHRQNQQQQQPLSVTQSAAFPSSRNGSSTSDQSSSTDGSTALGVERRRTMSPRALSPIPQQQKSAAPTVAALMNGSTGQYRAPQQQKTLCRNWLILRQWQRTWLKKRRRFRHSLFSNYLPLISSIHFFTFNSVSFVPTFKLITC